MSDPESPAHIPTRILVLAGLLLALLLFTRLWGHPLQDPDEGRYAEIPREMIESGDFVTPRLNYVRYFEKPPLLYWLVAAMFGLFGESGGAARLVPALSGWITVAATFLLGRRLFGARPAFLGAAILATCPIFFALTQGLIIDMLLTACITGTLSAYHLAQSRGTDDVRGRDRQILVVALAAALGVLAKGPVALVLPGAIALAHLAYRRDGTTTLALLHWKPIGVFLAVAAPWFIAVSIANEDFLHFFFVREHFERFASNVGHPEGPLYYLPVLFFGPLPWSAVGILLVLHREARAAWAAFAGPARVFLLIWAGVVLTFFTVSSSKLAPYILPAFPPLALLLGAWLDRLGEATTARSVSRWIARGYLTVAVPVVVTAITASFVPERLAAWLDVDLVDVLSVRTACFALAGLMGGTGIFVLRSERTARSTWIALAAGMALTLWGVLGARSIVKSSVDLADAYLAERRPGEELVTYTHLMQGLSFYTGQRIRQYNMYGELEFGALSAPDGREWFRPMHEIGDQWRAEERLFVATSRRRMWELEPFLDPPPKVLVRDDERLLLVNFDAPGSRDVRDTDRR